MDKKYVYNGSEVVLTGRTAERKRKTTKRVQTREDILHEITPADDEEGSWKKWVRLDELYEIR